LYGAAHTLRWRWYASRAFHLPRPVVSVGNLHWGGTGKTPLVAAVATYLRDRDLHPAILSRGYRSRGSGVRVVSTGEGPLLGPLVAGDEPVLLAGELPGVPVVVSGDRFAAGHHALERLDPAPRVFVLDDGFSHLRLFRDVDIVAFPSDDPFAGGRLLPGGRLREPLASLARADAVVMTGTPQTCGAELAETLRAYGFDGPGFNSPIHASRPRLVTGQPLAPSSRVLLVAAIARPERFVGSVRELGYSICEVLTFPDHHDYSPKSLERIAQTFERVTADAVLTTSKDQVKLLGRLQLPLASLPIHAEPEEGFWSWLDRRLEQQMAQPG
jgi:tetraacyldisaccharide 4'-kinase